MALATVVHAACLAVSDPVCGCDGTVYANDCERLMAGVALDDSLECLEAAVCANDDDCADGSTCDRVGCAEGAGGICVPTLGVCDAVYQPVCGCDGKTYLNDCDRRLASVAQASEGACP